MIMGRVKDLAIILYNVTMDGIESGYSGFRLRQYVLDEATNGLGINRAFVKQFIDFQVENIEEDCFNV